MSFNVVEVDNDWIVPNLEVFDYNANYKPVRKFIYYAFNDSNSKEGFKEFGAFSDYEQDKNNIHSQIGPVWINDITGNFIHFIARKAFKSNIMLIRVLKLDARTLTFKEYSLVVDSIKGNANILSVQQKQGTNTDEQVIITGQERDGDKRIFIYDNATKNTVFTKPSQVRKLYSYAWFCFR